MHKPHLPNLIIAGVHKAATTSLFMYLTSHPEIFGPDKKELHYFTPIRYGNEIASLDNYKKYFTNAGDKKYLIDASPSYIYGGEAIIKKMKEILPPHKIIVILRNPQARFLSYYNYLKAKLFLQTSDTMQDFLQQCIAKLNEPLTDNEYSRALKEGMYVNFIPPWVNAYGNDFKIIYFEELTNNPAKVMVDLAHWLSIDSSFFGSMVYTAENKTIFVKNKLMHSTALAVNHSFEAFWRRNHKLKTKIRSLYYAINKESKINKTADDESLKQLEQVYNKPNKELAEYLASKKIKLPAWLHA